MEPERTISHRVHWSPSTTSGAATESGVDSHDYLGNGQNDYVGNGGSDIIITKQPQGLVQGHGFQRPTNNSLWVLADDSVIEWLNCCFVISCCPCVIAANPFICPKEYERAVVFRLGKLRPGGARGPGVFFINPYFDEYKVVDMRIVCVDINPQEVLTKDGVMVRVDAVVFYYVQDAVASCCNVINFQYATERMSEGTLRSVLANVTLSDLLERKGMLAANLQKTLSVSTGQWGVDVLALEIKNIYLPNDMIRSMGTEAETTQLALAKAELSRGEEQASEHLAKASACLSNPSAVTLRSLKTLASIAQKSRSITIFPLSFPSAVWDWGESK